MRPVPSVLLIALLSVPPTLATAAPTVTCHCFRNRSYDPAEPAAADPYVLATTRSSLLSAAFGVDKGSLVRAVMGGTAPDDLWIAHWAAARAGGDGAALLEAKGKAGTWKAALGGSRGLGAEFERALAGGAEDAALSALAVDDVLVARLGADPEDVRILRAATARSEEVVIAAVLSIHRGTPAMPLLARVRTGGASWGSLLAEMGLAPGDLDAVVRAAVARAGPPPRRR